MPKLTTKTVPRSGPLMQPRPKSRMSLPLSAMIRSPRMRSCACAIETGRASIESHQIRMPLAGQQEEFAANGPVRCLYKQGRRKAPPELYVGRRDPKADQPEFEMRGRRTRLPA